MVVVYLGLRAGPNARRARLHPKTRRLPRHHAFFWLLHKEPGPDQYLECLRQRHEGGSWYERQPDQPRRHRLDRRLRRRPDSFPNYTD